jgi:hypothetical protein
LLRQGALNGAFPHTVWQPIEPNLIGGGAPVPHTNNLGSVLKVDFANFPDLLGFSGEVFGWSDSAIFKLDDATSQGRTISKKIVGHDGPPLLVDRVTATTTPTVFPQNVRKRGFKTGLTRGRVVGAQNSIQWTPGGSKARLKNQLEIEGSPSNPGGIFCVKGDSGSLVLADNSATAMGLLWGESHGGTRGMMSPIETVETRLNVKVVWT